MKTRRILILNIILCIALVMMVMPVMAETGSTAQPLTLPHGIDDALASSANRQDYMAEDGMHSIFWTQGIDAPLMSSDPELLGTGNYFEKHVEGSYVSYGYPMQDGAGYYDLNKNDTTVHCYLASASNTIHWWLEQNDALVREYIGHLKSGNIYGDTPGLRPLNSMFDENMWNRILTKPTLGINEIKNIDRYMQPLYSDQMVTTALSAYLGRTHDGYWPDLVWDYFFNGYTAIDGESPDPNHEDRFKKDHTGGYFYPLFARQKLSKRYDTGNYDFFNENLARILAEGNGVNLSYMATGNAHAITIWGAEYDNDGNIVRLFYTDSDDYDMMTNDPIPTVYGMRSYNVHRAQNGQMYLNNNTDPNTKAGAFVLGMYTLNLRSNELRERLDDLTDPMEPAYTEEPQDASYAIGSTPNMLTIKLAPKDTGYFRYAWYEATSETDDGEPILGEIKPTYTPDTSVPGTRYYYAKITNYKNGKELTFDTRRARIVVSSDIIDAGKPIISNNFSQGTVKIKQYAPPGVLRVNATSPDGGTLSYQWYTQRYTMANTSPTGGTPIIGATEPYLIPDTSEGEMYMRTKYYCIVTNTNDTVNGKRTNTAASNVIVYEVKQSVTLLNAKDPVIALEPVDQTDTSHGIEPLRVVAGSTDGGTLTYQWYMADSFMDEGTLIPNATSATYTPDAKAFGTHYYYAKITNTNAIATSNTTSTVESRRAMVNIAEQKVESNNSYLSSLSVSGHVLSPLFDKDNTQYTLKVAHDVAMVNIIAETMHAGAIAVGTGEHMLKVGENVIDITVTAEDGSSRIYTITITREEKTITPEPETPPTEPETPPTEPETPPTEPETPPTEPDTPPTEPETPPTEPETPPTEPETPPTEPETPPTEPETPPTEPETPPTEPETPPTEPETPPTEPETPPTEPDTPPTEPETPPTEPETPPTEPETPPTEPETPPTEPETPPTEPETPPTEPETPPTEPDTPDKGDVGSNANNTLAIGLGVGIPVGVVIIVLIIVIIIKRRG